MAVQIHVAFVAKPICITVRPKGISMRFMLHTDCKNSNAGFVARFTPVSDRLSTTWLVLTVKQKQKIKSDFETDLGSAPPLSLLHNHHHQEMNPDSSELQVVTKEGKCLVCGKVFANSQNARRHAREIHLESTSEYKCHICGSTYGRNRAYKEHMGKVHGLYRKLIPRLQNSSH